MDRELRKQIVEEVKRITEMVQREHWECYHEEWVSAKVLGERIGCFQAGWLKVYGRTLPRTQAVVVDENMVEHRTGWIYPLHKIQRMVMDGEIKNLKVEREDEEGGCGTTCGSKGMNEWGRCGDGVANG